MIEPSYSSGTPSDGLAPSEAPTSLARPMVGRGKQGTPHGPRVGDPPMGEPSPCLGLPAQCSMPASPDLEVVHMPKGLGASRRSSDQSALGPGVT